jgi:hypothetical protein
MIRPRLLHALALAVVCWTISAPRAATLSFIPQSNGGIVGIGSDIGCGTALSETLESAFDGFSVINGGYTPAVGEVWYAHVYVSHPGNPCNGGNYNEIDMLLPPNTTFAIDARNPVFCAYYSPSLNLTKVYYSQNRGCPQAPSAGVQGYAFWAFSGATPQPWLLASYSILELLIPLRSTAALNYDSMSFRINPDIGVYNYASVGVIVNDDVIFRDDQEGTTLIPDLCNVTTCTVIAP